MADTRPIGVFDSGVGGLTVVKELMRYVPSEDIVYIGDTARMPYGTKSAETIIKFSIENILFLLQHEVKMIIIACNTASSTVLPIVKRDFKVPIIGVIGPGAKESVMITKNKRIGVIATRTTIRSNAYENLIRALAPQMGVRSAPCPLFAPIVEEDLMAEPFALDVAKHYLKPLMKFNIDTLILGCTHYPLLKGVLKKVLGKGVAIVDSAEQVAVSTKDILCNESLDSPMKARPAKYEFYVTDEPAGFAQLGSKFLGKKLDFVKKVQL